MSRTTPAKPRPDTKWACYSPYGTIDTDSISWTRKAAIAKEVGYFSTVSRLNSWPKLYRRGWRCLLVSIVAVRS